MAPNVLNENGFIASMSRTANYYDNAAMESLWSTLKTELSAERMQMLPRNAVRQLVFEYIESYYNRSRLHSSLGYKTPVEFETNLT